MKKSFQRSCSVVLLGLIFVVGVLPSLTVSADEHVTYIVENDGNAHHENVEEIDLDLDHIADAHSDVEVKKHHEGLHRSSDDDRAEHVPRAAEDVVVNDDFDHTLGANLNDDSAAEDDNSSQNLKEMPEQIEAQDDSTPNVPEVNDQKDDAKLHKMDERIINTVNIASDAPPESKTTEETPDVSESESSQENASTTSDDASNVIKPDSENDGSMRDPDEHVENVENTVVNDQDQTHNSQEQVQGMSNPNLKENEVDATDPTTVSKDADTQTEENAEDANMNSKRIGTEEAVDDEQLAELDNDLVEEESTSDQIHDTGSASASDTTDQAINDTHEASTEKNENIDDVIPESDTLPVVQVQQRKDGGQDVTEKVQETDRDTANQPVAEPGDKREASPETDGDVGDAAPESDPPLVVQVEQHDDDGQDTTEKVQEADRVTLNEPVSADIIGNIDSVAQESDPPLAVQVEQQEDGQDATEEFQKTDNQKPNTTEVINDEPEQNIEKDESTFEGHHQAISTDTEQDYDESKSAESTADLSDSNESDGDRALPSNANADDVDDDSKLGMQPDDSDIPAESQSEVNTALGDDALLGNFDDTQLPVSSDHVEISEQVDGEDQKPNITTPENLDLNSDTMNRTVVETEEDSNKAVPNNNTETTKSEKEKNEPAKEGSMASFFEKVNNGKKGGGGFQAMLQQAEVVNTLPEFNNGNNDADKIDLAALADLAKNREYEGTWGIFKSEQDPTNLDLLFLLFQDYVNEIPSKSSSEDSIDAGMRRDRSPAEEENVMDADTSEILLDEEVMTRSANAEFVEGLDDISKLFEAVDTPDELDVGASGSSIHEVLMGKGKQILIKRVREVFRQIASMLKAIKEKAISYIYNEDGEFALKKEDLVVFADKISTIVRNLYQQARGMLVDIFHSEEESVDDFEEEFRRQMELLNKGQ